MLHDVIVEDVCLYYINILFQKKKTHTSLMVMMMMMTLKKETLNYIKKNVCQLFFLVFFFVYNHYSTPKKKFVQTNHITYILCTCVHYFKYSLIQ